MAAAKTKRATKKTSASGAAQRSVGDWPSLPPNITREDPPEFHRMSSTRFEELTCSLLDKEPGVLRADLYHTRFDSQYGIDCFGDLEGGMIVASCKCQKKIKKGEIAQWSNDFLQHWATQWEKQGVQKFILSTAAPTEHRNRLLDIEAEKGRFAAIGVEYEVWSPRQLQEHLRGHRGLVSQYIGAEFVTILCGEGRDSTLLGEALAVQAELETRVENLGAALSDEVEQRFELAMRTLQQGTVTKAIPLVQSLRDQVNWPKLSAGLRARIIRLEASIALAQGDVARASIYSDEADSLQAPDDSRLKANIVLHQKGAAEALKALGEPQTEPGRAFRSALLLSQHRLDEAAASITTLPDTPEKMRLQSLWHLLRGDRAEAKRVADAAMTRAPDNLHIRRLGVMARYALALSDLAEPEQYVFASPLAYALLRLDNAAVESLRDALRVVDDIIARGEPGSADLDWPWRLACLSNLSDKRTEASAQARDILSRKPTNAAAIGWVLVRGLSVDLSSSSRALWEALRSGTLEANGARALDWVTGPTDRSRLLQAVQEALATKTWPDDVRHELNILSAKLDDRSILEDDAGAVRRLEMAVLNRKPSAVIAEFRQLREEKPTPSLFLAAAEALATMGEWKSVAEGLPELLAFRTADAIRLAAYAALNSGDVLQTISILGENVAAFPGGRLPYDLRRMEVQALARRGEGQQALARAEALAAETQQLRDRIWEAQIRLEVGDLRGAASAIRIAQTLGNLPPQQALWWAQRFVQQDVELARSLWRSAVSSGPLPDQVAASAYHVSFELGLEHEKPELAQSLPRMVAAGAPGIQMFSVDDLTQFISENKERAARLDEMLTKGDVPIHLISSAANISLAELLWLDDGCAPGLRPVFLRSAARIDQTDDIRWDEWTLYIDVTGLMVADQLGLLDHIESQRNHPRIGPSTIQALISIEERVRHPQPRRVAAAEAILREIGRGIRLIPPTDAARVVHNPGDGEFDLAAIVTGLRFGGWIDDTTAAKARGVLNLSDSAGPVPQARQPIIFAEQTLDLLADAQLLSRVIAGFDVFLDPESLELTRAETNKGARSASLIAWIAALRDRVSRGLQGGIYVYAEKEVVPEEDDVKQDPVYLNLLELMRSSETETSNRLWVDDRLLNSYQTAGQSRIVGIVEVLEALRRETKINDDFYFECLRKLRIGGALFVSITVEEVSRLLTRAPIINGKIVETPGLVAIRRNVGLALLYQDALRLGPQQVAGETRPSEFPYILALRRLIERTIVERWNSNEPTSSIRAQVDWVWKALRIEHPPRSADGQQPKNLLVFAALNIAGLVGNALLLKGTGKRGRARRAAYFEWVEATAVNGRFVNDIKLAAEVGNLARTLIRPDKVDSLDFDDESRSAMRNATRLIVYELPPVLQEIIAADETFRRDLGIEVGGVLTIEKTPFLAEEFWNGVETATNGVQSEVKTADRDGHILIAPRISDWIFPISGAITVKLSEPAAGLLSRDSTVQDDNFTKLLIDMDIPTMEVDRVRQSLAAGKTANAKMRAVAELRERSIPYFLMQLVSALKQTAEVEISRFRPPPAADWLRYLRWQRTEENALDTSLSVALADLGRDEVAYRFSSLPVTLPREVESVLENRPAETLTLLGSIHRLHSLRMSGEPANPDLTEATDDAIKACLEQGSLFLALLRWGARCFMQQEDWPTLSAAEKHAIVWCYADKMTGLLVDLRVDTKATADRFGEHLLLPAARALNLELGYDDSPLQAGALSEAGVLLAGLEYGLASEADNIKPTDEQMRRLRAATIVLDDNGVPVCRPERALSFLPTPYPTWLSRPTPDAVIENGGQIELSLSAMVDKLDEDPDNPEFWSFLIAFGRPALPTSLITRLEGILERVSLEKLTDRDEDPLLAVRKVAEVASRLVSKVASDRILNELFALSRTWLGDRSDAKFEDKVSALVEAAASAAKAYDQTGPQRLSNFLRALIANRVGVANSLRPVLDALIDQTRVDEGGDFWKALLAARAG